MALNASLARLGYYINRFDSDLALHDWCEHQWTAIPVDERRGPEAVRFRSWKAIAGRDGAMTIFHFGKTMEGINAARRDLPEIFATINRAQQKVATKLFIRHFPQFESIRHAVAHAGEFMVDIEALRGNAVRGRMTVSDIFNGRLFTMTFGGKLVDYELSAATLNNLNEVKREYYLAFIAAGNPPTLPDPAD